METIDYKTNRFNLFKRCKYTKLSDGSTMYNRGLTSPMFLDLNFKTQDNFEDLFDKLTTLTTVDKKPLWDYGGSDSKYIFYLSFACDLTWAKQSTYCQVFPDCVKELGTVTNEVTELGNYQLRIEVNNISYYPNGIYVDFDSGIKGSYYCEGNTVKFGQKPNSTQGATAPGATAPGATAPKATAPGATAPKATAQKPQVIKLVQTNLTPQDILSGKVVQYGMTGNIVGQIQQLLINNGFTNISKSGAVDNKFGTRTNNAVIAFQNKMGISPDGKVGPMTWNKLNRLSLYNTAIGAGAAGAGAAGAVAPGAGDKVNEQRLSGGSPVPVTQRTYSVNQLPTFATKNTQNQVPIYGTNSSNKIYYGNQQTPNGQIPAQKPQIKLVQTNLTPQDILSGKVVTIGMTGNIVGQIQQLLINNGFTNVNKSGTVDNKFGTRTKNAVIAFQNKMGISHDGKVGPMTWNKLNRLSLVNTANQIGAGDNGVQTSYDSSTYKGGELGSPVNN